MANRFKFVADITVLAFLYYLTGRLGTLTAIPPGVATAIWPPSGVALAILLIRGIQLWPGVLLGSTVLNFSILHQQNLPWLISLAVSVAIAAGSTVQARLGVTLIRNFIGDEGLFGRVSGVSKFVGIETGSCLVACTVGATALCAGGVAPWSVFGETWFTWWLGDCVGILVVSPLILVWRYGAPFLRARARRLEFFFSLLGLFALAQIVFGVPLSSPNPAFPMAYVFIPFILWITFRMGLPGGVTAVFLTSVLAVGGTIHGTSQFVGGALNHSLLSVQLFVAVTAITGLTLGAVLLERKRLDEEKGRMLADEKRLRVELGRSNEDLERFARIASHDLREPLRTINSHLGLLARSAKEKLNADEMQSLHFVMDGSERMQRLIRALLGYAMPGSRSSEVKWISCAEVLREALTACRSTIEESGAQVSFDPLPSLHGDSVQIERLFLNLIGNALKYHGDHSPVVHISSKRQYDEWLFSVKDNGIGIDMQYAEKIFQAFARLHGAAEYPGSGLGLSVCRKIVEQHGGRIWVESQPGMGATFLFTLPVTAAS